MLRETKREFSSWRIFAAEERSFRRMERSVGLASSAISSSEMMQRSSSLRRLVQGASASKSCCRLSGSSSGSPLRP